jgi:hypothetical protein
LLDDPLGFDERPVEVLVVDGGVAFVVGAETKGTHFPSFKPYF